MSRVYHTRKTKYKTTEKTKMKWYQATVECTLVKCVWHDLATEHHDDIHVTLSIEHQQINI